MRTRSHVTYDHVTRSVVAGTWTLISPGRTRARIISRPKFLRVSDTTTLRNSAKRPRPSSTRRRPGRHGQSGRLVNFSPRKRTGTRTIADRHVPVLRNTGTARSPRVTTVRLGPKTCHELRQLFAFARLRSVQRRILVSDSAREVLKSGSRVDVTVYASGNPSRSGAQEWARGGMIGGFEPFSEPLVEKKKTANRLPKCYFRLT